MGSGGALWDRPYRNISGADALRAEGAIPGPGSLRTWRSFGIHIRDGFWETWMEGRNLGKQITPGGQSFGGGWNLVTVCGYWNTLQWAIIGETLVEQNMDLCGGCEVSALMRF